MAHQQRKPGPCPAVYEITNYSPAFTRNVRRTPGPRPRHLLHASEPTTGYQRAIPRRESARHPSVAGSRVQRRNHRERLVDVGSPSQADTTRRNEVAKSRPEPRELAERYRAPPTWRVFATTATAGSAHEFTRTPHVHGCWPATDMMLHQTRCTARFRTRGTEAITNPQSTSACP